MPNISNTLISDAPASAAICLHLRRNWFHTGREFVDKFVVK